MGVAVMGVAVMGIAKSDMPTPAIVEPGGSSTDVADRGEMEAVFDNGLSVAPVSNRGGVVPELAGEPPNAKTWGGLAPVRKPAALPTDGGIGLLMETEGGLLTAVAGRPDFAPDCPPPAEPRLAFVASALAMSAPRPLSVELRSPGAK